MPPMLSRPAPSTVTASAAKTNIPCSSSAQPPVLDIVKTWYACITAMTMLIAITTPAARVHTPTRSCQIKFLLLQICCSAKPSMVSATSTSRQVRRRWRCCTAHGACTHQLGPAAQAGYDFDIEHCPHCGGTLKIIAAIENPHVIAKILTHLSLSARAPPRSPARPFDRLRMARSQTLTPPIRFSSLSPQPPLARTRARRQNVPKPGASGR